MHELSIAYSLVQAADESAKQAGVSSVKALYLQLGAMSGVVQDALLFSYDIAAQGTRLEGSELVIETLPVIVYCPNCKRESELENIQLFRCPQCGEPTGDIRQGREIDLVSLEIDDDLEEDPHHEATHS